MDASHQHTVEEAIDWNDAAGGAELRDFAAGWSKPGSFGEVAARLHHEPNLVLTLRGCPRLTVPLAGGLADAVEATIRHGFELSRPLRQSAPLPWAGRPADELHVSSSVVRVVHWQRAAMHHFSTLMAAFTASPRARRCIS